MLTISPNSGACPAEKFAAEAIEGSFARYHASGITTQDLMRDIDGWNEMLVDDRVTDGYLLADVKYKFVGVVDPRDHTVTIEVTADAGEWLAEQEARKED